MAKGWERVKAAWSYYRQVVAIKGLLQTLGVWKWVIGLVSAVVGVLVASYAEWPLWERVVVGLLGGLVTLVLLLEVVAVVLAFKKFSGGQNYSDGPILTLAFSKVQTPEPVFKDGTIFHTFRLSELLLTNRTVYDAYEVILMPTPIGEYQIFSSIPLTVLANNEGRIEYRVITSEGGTDYGHIEFAHNLAPLLDEVHKETGLGNLLLVFNLAIKYKDSFGKRYESTFKMKHHPGMYGTPLVSIEGTKRF